MSLQVQPNKDNQIKAKDIKQLPKPSQRNSTAWQLITKIRKRLYQGNRGYGS
jgi:hypothetical protein